MQDDRRGRWLGTPSATRQQPAWPASHSCRRGVRLTRLFVAVKILDYEILTGPGWMQEYVVGIQGNSRRVQKAHKVRTFVYGMRSDIDLHVDYVSHQLIRNVFQKASRVE